MVCLGGVEGSVWEAMMPLLSGDLPSAEGEACCAPMRSSEKLRIASADWDTALSIAAKISACTMHTCSYAYGFMQMNASSSIAAGSCGMTDTTHNVIISAFHFLHMCEQQLYE